MMESSHGNARNEDGQGFSRESSQAQSYSPLLSLKEVADYLKVHPSTIRRLVGKKELPALRIGKGWRFNLESIDRWRLEREH